MNTTIRFDKFQLRWMNDHNVKTFFKESKHMVKMNKIQKELVNQHIDSLPQYVIFMISNDFPNDIFVCLTDGVTKISKK